MTTKRAVIIGGGLGGLAAAVETARRGAHVTIVEQNEHLGGKMNVLTEGAFSFDMGPTIITLPEVLTGIIRRAGREPDELIDLVNLDPQWRCFYEDGVTLDLLRDADRMAAALDAQFPESAPGRGYKRFIDFSRRMYRLSEKVFFYRDMGSVFDMMKSTRPGDLGVMRDVAAMRAYSTVGATAKTMLNEPHLRQLSEHFLQYVGSSPFLSPAILALIASAQVDHGCWYPMGGTRRVAASLETLARDFGVEVMTGRRVGQILNDNGAVAGVRLDDGTEIQADAVVSNCDVQRTNRDLLATPAGKREQERIASKYRPACSGVVLYLGLDRQYEQLAHHNFFFSEDSHREFDDIYGRGVPAEDPTLYIAAPSRTDPDQAPPGGEALYVLVHTPYLRPGVRWDGPDGELERYRETILDKMERMGLAGVREHIVVERSLTPANIERMYNAEGGAIYGLASHGRLAGGFKPRNRSRVLRNLYLAGGSANPGPGAPMAMMSGVTAANALAEDLSLPDVRSPEELIDPPLDMGKDTAWPTPQPMRA